jgi:hypothetical protein
VAATFFDARDLKPHEQLRDCIEAAVTSLFTARVATLFSLDSDEVERCAFEQLHASPGVAALAHLTNFDHRQRETVNVVVKVVVEVCVAMLPDSSRQREFPSFRA